MSEIKLNNISLSVELAIALRGQGKLDAWLEVHNEEDIRNAILNLYFGGVCYKEHEKRELINAVCSIARGFHSHQSLRDRIASILLPAFEVIILQESNDE
jgi:hypothetical protein